MKKIIMAAVCLIAVAVASRAAVASNTVEIVYSFHALINTKMSAVTMPGVAMGASTFVSAETVPQPSIRDASSISGEMDTKVPRSSQIAKA